MTEEQNKQKPWTVMVPTTEDWCPTVNGELSLTLTYIYLDKLWRVCVWGGDDIGMEKDFASYSEARNIFEQASKVKNMSRSYLDGLGFRIS